MIEARATEARWEHFPHAADMGVRGLGPSMNAAFEQAAMALTAVVTDPKAVAPNEAVEIACSAPDQALLLADWLNAVVYEMSTRKMLFGRFEVRIDGDHLSGKAFGERVEGRRHRPAVEIKGATYTELGVRREQGQWIAQCVVDV